MIRTLLAMFVLVTGAIEVSAQGLPTDEPPCDGVPIDGEFVLDRDIACSVTLNSGATLDLNGFTVEGGVSLSLYPWGPVTLKNGTVLRGRILGAQGMCSGCTIENVRVIDSPPLELGRGKELDRGFAARRSINPAAPAVSRIPASASAKR